MSATTPAKKPVPLAPGWTEHQWQQLFQLEDLINEVTMINAGSHCLRRIAKCIAVAEDLRKSDFGRGPQAGPGLAHFLKERALADPVAVERQGLAMAACVELIKGDGTTASHQKAIDLARQALGLPVS